MEFMTDLMCNFIRQWAEADAGQGHTLAVFVIFFRFQFGVAGVPDEKEVLVFHKAQFFSDGFSFQQLIAVLGSAYRLGERAIEPFFLGCLIQYDFCPIAGDLVVFFDRLHTLSHADGVGEKCQ